MSQNHGVPGPTEPAGSLLWTSAGVVAVGVVAVWPGVPVVAAALGLAAIMAGCAVLRLVLPEPAPMAIRVRGRMLDVAVLGGLAVALAVLGLLLPR